MTRRTSSIAPDWFEALYTADPDPWRFATSAYEREKYAATLAALPRRRFAAALEVGCAIGVFTRQLAARCDRLLAVDVSQAALASARRRCPDGAFPGLRFEQRRIPADWPPGTYDLIIFSEVLYYLDAADIARTADCLRAGLAPGGSALLVHYLGATDYPCTGDEAAACFIAASGLPVGFSDRQPGYRIDRLDRPAADAPGCPAPPPSPPAGR